LAAKETGLEHRKEMAYPKKNTGVSLQDQSTTLSATFLNRFAGICIHGTEATGMHPRISM
jgi:hypothetical protein